MDAEPDPFAVGWSSLERYNTAVQRALPQISAETAQGLGLFVIQRCDLISVVVPVFNEGVTIGDVLRRLADCPAVGQIIVVNDASSDATADRLAEVEASKDDPFWSTRLPEGLMIVTHPTNQGKGAALRTGFPLARLPWIGIQDADNEYNPQDLMRLLAATKQHSATVAYGSRYLLRNNHCSPWWHRWGNGLITACANGCNGLRLTDVETCYKLVDAKILQSIAPTLKENRFGIEIELTAKLARHPGAKFTEQAISYDKRSYAEGKKIGVRDGLRALWCMLRYRWSD